MMGEAEIGLIEPSEKLREGYLDYANEFTAAEEGYIHGSGVKMTGSFSEFVQLLQDHGRGMKLPKGYVPASTYWLVSEGRVLGTCNLRHRLTDWLREEGGHIGDGIRPSERGKGYGTAILRLLLEKAKEVRLAKVLVTCDKDNLASARVIQKNGGRLDNESVSKESGKMKQRYWIEL